MKNYKHFLNESRGISNTIKNYVDIIFNLFDFKNHNIIVDLTDDYFILKNLQVNFKKYKNNNSEFNPINNKLIDNELHNIIINIQYVNDDENEVKELINHELTHCLEFYNIIKNNRKLEHIKYKKVLIDTKYQNFIDDLFYRFRLNIYNTLDNELNARVSQLYHKIIHLGEEDIDKIKDLIKQTDIWKICEDIENFDVKNFVDNMINKITLDKFIILTNELTNKTKLYNITKFDIVNNKEDLYVYYNLWKKLFKNKISKHKDKLLNMSKEISKDVLYYKNFNNKDINEMYQF